MSGSVKRAFWMVSLLPLLTASNATAITWDGNGAVPPDGVFSDPLNWDTNTVPSGSATASFSLDAAYTVTFTGNQTSGTVALLNGTVTWLSNSATVRQYNVTNLVAGGDESLTIGSSTNPVAVAASSEIELGSITSSSSGTINVSGASSSLNGSSAVLGNATDWDGTLRYQNGAQGKITGAVSIGNSANDGSDGLLEVLSGADFASGNLNLATTSSTATGTINVTGAGSTQVQGGAATLTVGSATGGTGTINVNTGGSFTTGTGLTTVNTTGTIHRTDTGVYNVSGNLTLNGGQFLTPAGSFSRGASLTLTVQSGGLFSATPPTAPTNVGGTPAGTLSSAGTVTIASGEIRFNGGRGANGPDIFSPEGTNGGAGGILQVTAGTFALSGTGIGSFVGGTGGSEDIFGSGGAGAGGTGGQAMLSGGALSLADNAQLNFRGGVGGLGGNFNSGGIGGLGGQISVTGTTVTLDQSALLSLDGGAGGSVPNFASGGAGGAGGTYTVFGGSTTLSGSAALQLRGGSGGNGGTGISNGNGGAGGAGGTLNVSAGTLTVNAGTVTLAGGAGGAGGPFGSPGAAGANGSVNVTGGTFTMNGGEVFAGTFARSGAGTVNLSGGTLTAGTIEHTSGGGAFNFTGGVLHVTTFNGNLTNAGGTLAPGASPGTTAVNGNYSQSAGTLEIELGGTSGGQFDALNVTGDVTLGGALDVKLFGPFTPSVGQSWKIVDIGGTRSGTFGGLGEGSWVRTFGSTNLFITYAGGNGNDVVLNTAAALAGDYNLNGTVDTADYTVWRDHLGAPAGTLPNDTVGGAIDEDQYNLWKANFGAHFGTGSGSLANSVPEPSTVVLLIPAALCWCLRLRLAASRVSITRR